ncbi:MAG: MerR family transcriptional regulator [Peptococcaceae bacterium]|nr:MerR family transcriptional regulator [Peptococcaceae bacterium]
MGRGLLPPPDGAGLGTTYSDEHLYRIILIKKLQDAYLPLDEIRKRMAVLSLAEVVALIHSDTIPARTEAPLPGALPGTAAGAVYERISVGYGLELHYPSGDKKARELAEKIYAYAEKIMKEG